MKALLHRLRPTIRVRLTLLYGGLFLIGGVVLLALTYFLVRNSLSPSGPVGQGTPGTPPSGTSLVVKKGVFTELPPDTLISAREAQHIIVRVKDDSQQEILDSVLTQGAIALSVVTAACQPWAVATHPTARPSR